MLPFPFRVYTVFMLCRAIDFCIDFFDVLVHLGEASISKAILVPTEPQQVDIGERSTQISMLLQNCVRISFLLRYISVVNSGKRCHSKTEAFFIRMSPGMGTVIEML